MTDEDAGFLEAFEQRTLPAGLWNHRAHLRVAYLYLANHPFDEGLSRIRSGIQAYNAATGVVDGRTMGYHETLTVAWARLVRAAIDVSPPAEDSRAFLESHPALMVRALLREFYTQGRITTWQAKWRFVEPDLASLPEIRNEHPEGTRT